MIALSRLGGAHNAPEFRDARQTIQCFVGNLCAAPALSSFALIAHTPRVPPASLLNAA